MGEMVTVKTTDGTFAAYLARPAMATKAPAIVVIQEIFGINADMRTTCDDFAAQGYIAICPDLYWRQEPGVELTDATQAEWDKALKLYTAFDVPAGVKDIDATIKYTRALDGAGGKIGAVGYCLGGLLAFLTAARTDADAVTVYYGVNIDKYLGEAGDIRQPVLMHIAEEDEFVPRETWTQIVAALSGKANLEIHTYPGCSHAFARNKGVHFDAASAQAANDRTAAFFRANLS
ncbi:dienelactone hydrolase family protein [Cupriavidus sp. 2TAF22]|uniref:dienelactone hydrolase family protein n=1 Tax=unclassified Cupriavidus TaxID=2640874 RepID=UPI003F9066E4